MKTTGNQKAIARVFPDLRRRVFDEFGTGTQFKEINATTDSIPYFRLDIILFGRVVKGDGSAVNEIVASLKRCFWSSTNTDIIDTVNYEVSHSNPAPETDGAGGVQGICQNCLYNGARTFSRNIYCAKNDEVVGPFDTCDDFDKRALDEFCEELEKLKNW